MRPAGAAAAVVTCVLTHIIKAGGCGCGYAGDSFPAESVRGHYGLGVL
jgi:hypothetical protein